MCNMLRSLPPMDIHELLAKITDDSGRAIAKKLGVSERTILHQISTGRMPLNNVIAIADAYGYSPIRALVDIGELDESWVHVPDVASALRDATDEELTDEFLRRLKAAPNPEWDEPVGDLEARRRSRVAGSPRSATDEQGEPEKTTPSVRDVDQDLEEALRDANAMRGAAQHRTPRLEEPDEP